MARRNLTVRNAPVTTRMRAAPRANIDRIRSRAKLVVKEYDYDNYIVGIKRSTLFVKKLFVAMNDKNGDTLSVGDVEAEIRERINEGAYDRDLTDGYIRLRRAPRRRRRTEAD